MIKTDNLLKLTCCFTVAVLLLADSSTDAGRRRRRGCCDEQPCCGATSESSTTADDAAPAPVPEEAPYEEPAEAPDDDEANFISLFNGENLEGWQGATDGYEVLDGGVLASKAESGGNLFTNDEYANFIYRFEFKLTPGANNGIALRAPLDGVSAYTGMEIQVLDDTADQYKDLQPYQYHGSVYGVVPAEKGHQNPVGEWNTQEIVCDGKHVKVTLNGHVIVDANIEEASTPETLDKQEHPGLKRDSGFIGFCGHGAIVEFRNLRVKTLE
ncbi:MAG: DUF1080 domain-containing protein [Planctomycetota bacterium]|nr:DUF1080 domain-containing protein [Planctomycetota bacterium]MDA1212150.1 DUF1080 domain-containing protein [Planctomycetota bacterium]